MSKGGKQKKARSKASDRVYVRAEVLPSSPYADLWKEEPVLYQRNRLISKMLQNRGVLRIICAPHGYGKSALAREYERRMFPGKRTEWVDASTPSFLAELDRGHLQGFDELSMEQPALIVIDGIPWLHEQRTATLSQRIDAALYRGIEVLATTLPSCDCLETLQAERVYVSAVDLELTEQDCLDAQENSAGNNRGQARRQQGQDRARAAQMWQRACSEPLGKVAAVAWGSEEGRRERVLEQFFEERIPIGAKRVAFAVLILGSGSFSDLERVGAELREESIRMFTRDYPFLGIDRARGSFSVPKFDFGEVRRAMEQGGAAELFGPQSGLFMGRTLGILMQRGDLARIEEALGVFCTDAQCAHWLLDSGWKLLDRGQAELVDALLERCPEPVFDGTPALQVLRAWTSGMLGEARESRYYAQMVLADRQVASAREDEGLQACGALSYLALVAFGASGASIYRKGEFSADAAPLTVEGFIARVTDLCSESEVSRALAEGAAGDGGAHGADGGHVDETRWRALSVLFTGSAERFRGEPFFRLAFHLLCAVESEELKPVVQGIGCELAVRARRSNALTCTEALVVRDLWRTGFFGVMGPGRDKRDAGLLEQAAGLLREMARKASRQAPCIPWDIDADPGRAQALPKVRKAEDGEVPLARVRLFGGFEVVVGERYIKDAAWRKKARMLLILVVLKQGRDVSRDRLLEELWPGMPRSRALDNFYSAWSSTCSTLGDGSYLERSGSFCRVNPRYLISDVAEFEKLTRRLLTEHPDTNTLLDVYARIEALYRGGLVPGETKNELVNAQRERYEASYVDAMVSAVECSLKANDARLALWFARKAKEFGKQREDVYQALIRAQVAAGQRCSAIRSYFECREFLRNELGLDPSGEVQELYNQLISVDPTLLRLEPSSFRRG